MLIEIINGETRVDDVKTLFTEYAASLGIDLGYQNFDDEFASLPGKYARPYGRLYLAFGEGTHAGCFSMRKLIETRGNGIPATASIERSYVLHAPLMRRFYFTFSCLHIHGKLV